MSRPTALHWARRFLLFFVGAALLLLPLRLARGDAVAAAALFALGWATISAAVYTLVAYRRFRRHPACMLPRGSVPPEQD